MNRANQAGKEAEAAKQASNRNAQDIGGLRSVIANLDDYKLKTSVSVPFKFNKYALDDESKQELDKVAAEVKSGRRFFVAVEGYTDAIGSRQYNEALSRRRADAVVQYLVAKHDIPIYRIHMIGLGDQRPIDENPGRAARAKNRRVEVKVFSAEQSGVSADRAAKQSTESAASSTR
jgi:outer membrane protein OmpA-like peptidoglycan-associated protein